MACSLGDWSSNQLCWNCANREAIEPLGCVFWPLGVLCFFARDGRVGGGGVSSHGGWGGSCGNTGSSGVLDDWASNQSFFDSVSPTLLSIGFCGTKLTPDP